MRKLITGNEAVAWGALRAGVKLVSGYPGTPSTGCLTSLLNMKLIDTHIEWSTNEKVAFEIATGVAWSGHRAMCTMKMSGVNVAFDSLVSIAHSGIDGALVIYVADDPGANAGMVEQDSRGFAMMADLPVLEPSSVAEAYELTKFAFDLSESTNTPVFLRTVTAIAESYAEVDVEDPKQVSRAEPLLKRDIYKYTKAGALIATSQHRDVIQRLDKASKIISEKGLNRLYLSKVKGGLGIVSVGAVNAYLNEGFEFMSRYGLNPADVSVLRAVATNPFPVGEVQGLLAHCNVILVLEELEPYLERFVYVEAQKIEYMGKIIGKLDGTLSRIGSYQLEHVVKAIAVSLKLSIPEDLLHGSNSAEQLAAPRPITVCAGCPHRGTFMAINQAIRKSKIKKDEVMVTGDIGCTILGMNPPFNTIWTEISMGASVSQAQGYIYAGVKTPVISTIGDSTFFHAGIPGLINAIQHQVNLTFIIMDNRWTAMTGMQINPGTPCVLQATGYVAVDLEKIIPALGVEHFFIVDPFKLDETTETIRKSISLTGVKVILSRQECAIQAQRRGIKAGRISIVTQNCNLCKLCIMVTGCPALNPGEKFIQIDPILCYGCGLCVQTCNRKALIKEPVV